MLPRSIRVSKKATGLVSHSRRELSSMLDRTIVRTAPHRAFSAGVLACLRSVLVQALERLELAVAGLETAGYPTGVTD